MNSAAPIRQTNTGLGDASCEADNAWDEAIAAAFGDSATPPAAVGESIVAALSEYLGSLPRVTLPRSDSEPVTYLRRASSTANELALHSAPRFQFFGKIGQGGMGEVYFARDTDLGRDLAVKVLLPSHMLKPELARRFLYEAQVAGQLEHPAIPPVYELGRLADNRPFFAMKLVRGQTLAAILRDRRDALDQLVRHLDILTQVCQAMAYAHSRGVIHRDLKPSNIMVGAFGEVQVMDWGLAKVLPTGAGMPTYGANEDTATYPSDDGEHDTGRLAGSNTTAGSVVGTPAYMSPEQAVGQIDALDQRTDVFSLGSILCEILTGKPAYAPAADVDLRTLAAQANQADARRRLAECPADPQLVGLVEDCLALKPADRPRSASEIAERLTSHRQSVEKRLRDAELATVAATAKAAEERRRRWLSVALSLVLTTVIGSAVTIAAWWYQKRQQSVEEVEFALKSAANYCKAEKWDSMGMELERAFARLGPEIPANLRSDFSRLERDHIMVGELRRIVDETRNQGPVVSRYRFYNEVLVQRKANLRFDPETRYPCHDDYLKAFATYGINLEQAGPEKLADCMRTSAIRDELVAGVLHWARLSGDEAWRNKLLNAAIGESDSHWRRRFCVAHRDRDKESLVLLSRSAEALEERPGVLWYAGIVLQDGGLLDDGIVLMRRAQERFPGHYWINYDLGKALSNANPPKLRESIGYFRAALAIHSDSASHNYTFASRLYDVGDVEGALHHLHRAIAINAKDAEAHALLGTILESQGKQEEAGRAYRNALSIDPDAVLVHLHLATGLVHAGNLVEATRHIERTAEIAPDIGYFPYAFGRALVQCDEGEAAIVYLQKAISLNEALPDAHYLLGVALRQTGDFENALAAFEAARGKGSDRDELAARIRETRQMLLLERQLADGLPIDAETHPDPLGLARVAFLKKRYHTCLHIIESTIEKRPQLAGNWRVKLHFNAACAAALASAGHGIDAQDMADDGRALLRQKCLTWMQKDLASLKETTANGGASATREAAQHLANAHRTRLLATVRESRYLEQLPPDERSQWQSFWTDVEQTHKALAIPSD
jgi:serine/threonine-protein kinase